MSQSKSVYGVESPKDSARAHRHSPDTSGAVTDDEPEPACRSRANGRSIERREWCVKPFTDGIREFYEPCRWCFSDGPPDVGDIEKIVRSSRHPTVYHRPQTPDCDSATEQHDHSDSEADCVATVRESIGEITELGNGDGIVWEGRTTPPKVVGTTTDPSGTVLLEGPISQYVLEGRPNCPRQFYIQHFGYRDEIYRIVPADGRQETV